ncbi:GPP34 family phosphoprotein [Nocardioides yefusunii]|uniref:GPP34 family phosphoprotein n=1 Tax=Nocardioides yefusunii TaxID=2500546 RepID=A0ABW1QVJ4_9ACTN
MAALDPKAGHGVFASDRIIAVAPPPGPTQATEADPLLARAWSIVAERPRSPSDVVTRLGKGAREDVAARLVDRGILERVDATVCAQGGPQRPSAQGGQASCQGDRRGRLGHRRGPQGGRGRQCGTDDQHGRSDRGGDQLNWSPPHR